MNIYLIKYMHIFCAWPLRSPHFTVCNCFLRVFVKDHFHRHFRNKEGSSRLPSKLLQTIRQKKIGNAWTSAIHVWEAHWIHLGCIKNFIDILVSNSRRFNFLIHYLWEYDFIKSAYNFFKDFLYFTTACFIGISHILK